jgi:hypothetical protein
MAMRTREHEATRGIVRVGDGRGFIVEGAYERLIVTAAQCLPFLPPCGSISHVHERTYQSLIGQLSGECTIWGECLFVDPVGDIAVLGSPDSQEFDAQSDDYEAYEAMVRDTTPLTISEAPSKGNAWVLSLNGRWFECSVKRFAQGSLWISGANEGIAPGMSGSPILLEDGSAIGIVCAGRVSRGMSAEDVPVSEGGPNPGLTRNLPGWLLREIAKCPANKRGAKRELLGE